MTETRSNEWFLVARARWDHIGTVHLDNPGTAHDAWGVFRTKLTVETLGEIRDVHAIPISAMEKVVPHD